MSKEIEVIWKDGQRGSWCQAIVEFLTAGFAHRMDTPTDRVQGQGAIVVVKADQIKSMAELNEYVHSLKWCLLFVTANEDGTWQWDRFKHPNSLVWLQTPHRTQHAHRYLPWGWTPGCSVEVHSKKIFDWSFAGQVTHQRRKACVLALQEGPMRSGNHWSLVETSSFGQQEPMNQEEYYRVMAASKVIPCPSGPVTVDSLRVCEALQLGAIPVVDCISPTGVYIEYWNRVFGKGAPFFWIIDWEQFREHLDVLLQCWETSSVNTQKWWQQWKADLQASVVEDLRNLGAL